MKKFELDKFEYNLVLIALQNLKENLRDSEALRESVSDSLECYFEESNEWVNVCEKLENELTSQSR